MPMAEQQPMRSDWRGCTCNYRPGGAVGVTAAPKPCTPMTAPNAGVTKSLVHVPSSRTIPKSLPCAPAALTVSSSRDTCNSVRSTNVYFCEYRGTYRMAVEKSDLACVKCPADMDGLVAAQSPGVDRFPGFGNRRGGWRRVVSAPASFSCSPAEVSGCLPPGSLPALPQ